MGAKTADPARRIGSDNLQLEIEAWLAGGARGSSLTSVQIAAWAENYRFAQYQGGNRDVRRRAGSNRYLERRSILALLSA